MKNTILLSLSLFSLLIPISSSTTKDSETVIAVEIYYLFIFLDNKSYNFLSCF